jgi:uncharacterized protein YfaT (DUF1175 family)
MDRRRLVAPALALAAVLLAAAVRPSAQVGPLDASDRDAFRAWFTFLADAQFYRPTPDVTDCAGLVRHAVREALRAHTTEWVRQAALPVAPAIPDVTRRPAPGRDGWLLFKVASGRYAEFADARTIVTLNAHRLGRDVRAARPGDLLYFHQDGQDSPDHLMVVVGPSRFESGGADWLVYHTGPIDGRPGEVRKTRLADLLKHPSARWRPLFDNPSFIGVFRLNLL